MTNCFREVPFASLSMDTTEDGAESSISPSPTTSISSISWASSTSTEAQTWQPLCLFRFLRPQPPTPPQSYHQRIIKGALARKINKSTEPKQKNVNSPRLMRRQPQPPNKIILAPVKENLGSSAPELNEVLRTIQEAWPTQRSRSSASRREPRGGQDRHRRTSCGCRVEGEGEEEEEEDEEGEEEEEEEEEEEDYSGSEMGASCRSVKAADEGEARTLTATGQSTLPHQLPRRRYSVPEVVIRKFRLAAEEQWGQTAPAHITQQTAVLSPQDDEWSRQTPQDREYNTSPQKITYQNRGSQAGGQLRYLGSPNQTQRLELGPPSPPVGPSASNPEVLSLIPRYSALPRTDSMSVNVGRDRALMVAPPSVPIISKGAESEDFSLVDSLEDEAVMVARRVARSAATPAESPAKSIASKPHTPLVGGEAFFVAIGSSSPATSISLSGSSPSPPCSSEKPKQPERVIKPSLSVGPETVSAMPKRLRDRLAQRHRRLIQKMERQRTQRRKAEEAALTKKTVPKPPKLRNLSRSSLRPQESQSKPSQPQRRLPLGQLNRANSTQPGGRTTKASGPIPSSRGGSTPLRPRGGAFQQKFKCIPEDRSLHLGSSSSSTPPSSISASSNSEEEEVEVDVISVEAGSETDAARLRPRLRSENAKKLGGRSRSRSVGGKHGGLKPLKALEVGPSELQTIKEESKGSIETENEGSQSATNKEKTEAEVVNDSKEKENEPEINKVLPNDTNNNTHFSGEVKLKREETVSQPADSNILIRVEQNGEHQLDGAPPTKSSSDDDSRSQKRNGRGGTLKRHKTTDSVNFLGDQISQKGKVALGIVNNNEEDLVSLSCGWLNFYLMHTELKSSCEEEDPKSSKKEDKGKDAKKEKETKPSKISSRTALRSREAKTNQTISVPDPNGNGFPTKLPQIVSPENSPTQENVQVTNLGQHRSRLPRPLQANRVQNTQYSLVPISNQSALARPTHLSFLPTPARINSDSSQAPHSSSPTSPSFLHPSDRRHRNHRRRKGRDIDWGEETSTGTQTGESGQNWSVTIAGSCPQPDVEMRLTFPTSQGRNRCSDNRGGRQHQSDSGLGEENGMGRGGRGRTATRTNQPPTPMLPSSVPPQDPSETWLLTLRNENANPGAAMEGDTNQPHFRLRPLKCLPEISSQPTNQNGGTKNKAHKVTVRANRATSLRLRSAHPGFVPDFLENNTTTAEKEDTNNKSLSLFWPKVRRALEQKQLEQNNDRDALCHEIDAMRMMLGSKEKIPVHKMPRGRAKLEVHGSALAVNENSREMERTIEALENKSKISQMEWRNSQMRVK